MTDITNNTRVQTTLGPGNFVRETEKAFALDFGTGIVWFPKSQASWETHDHMTATLTLPVWLAQAKGMVRRNPHSRSYDWLFQFETVD
jgi:hypothetical protein